MHSSNRTLSFLCKCYNIDKCALVVQLCILYTWKYCWRVLNLEGFGGWVPNGRCKYTDNFNFGRSVQDCHAYYVSI